MAWAPLHPPSKRIEVAALMRESELSPAAVAERSGVSYVTVCRWNRVHGWRPSVARTSLPRRIKGWPAARVAALSRVYRVPGVDPADLAEVLGSARDRADGLFTALGFPNGLTEEDVGERGRYRDAQSKVALNRRLRAHVARQIAAFDRKLSEDAAGPGVGSDSTRLLRDLVGLKRLLDDLDAAPVLAAAEDEPMDLAALRADLVRRYEAFERAEDEVEAAAFELPVSLDASARTPDSDDASIR